jgi:hypothetical protein
LILDNMKRHSVTDTLRATIRASGVALLTIEQQTGVQRASLSRFMRRLRHLRSDAVDKLAAYFGLELKPARRRPRRKG